jgi:Xaa-Pro aminopeptidase
MRGWSTLGADLLGTRCLAQETPLIRDGGAEIGCAAEVLIAAEEMRSWMQAATVDEHASWVPPSSVGNARCVQPTKLQDYLAAATPPAATSTPGFLPAATMPAIKTMEEVEQEQRAQSAAAVAAAAAAAAVEVGEATATTSSAVTTAEHKPATPQPPAPANDEVRLP